MNDIEKIYGWCDRYQTLSGIQHGVLVYRTSTRWIADVQEFSRAKLCWNSIESATGLTPEEAIAKLVEALGL